MRSKLASLRHDFWIRQMHTRGVEGQLAGVDYLPGNPVDVKMVETDEARINSIGTLVAVWIDEATLVRYHKGAPLTDGDDWWTNFYFDRHVILLNAKICSLCHSERSEESSRRCEGFFATLRMTTLHDSSNSDCYITLSWTLQVR